MLFNGKLNKQKLIFLLQISAVEAIISSTSKHSKASFVVQNGTNLLKTLYKTTKSDAVKVRHYEKLTVMTY